jgi:hypothetical protein
MSACITGNDGGYGRWEVSAATSYTIRHRDRTVSYLDVAQQPLRVLDVREQRLKASAKMRRGFFTKPDDARKSGSLRKANPRSTADWAVEVWITSKLDRLV